MERLETAEKQLAESNSALNREDWSSKPDIGHLLAVGDFFHWLFRFCDSIIGFFRSALLVLTILY